MIKGLIKLLIHGLRGPYDTIEESKSKKRS